MSPEQERKNLIEANRDLYLQALRSGNYRKGTTSSDEKGRPIIKGPEDEGSCACAIMHDMFFTYKGTHSSRNYLETLDLTPEQCRYIQQNLNDSPMPFEDIADVIETKVFGRVIWGYAYPMKVRKGSVYKFLIIPGNHLGGLSGRCRIDKFERVPHPPPGSVGFPIFRPGDLLVYITLESRQEHGSFTGVSIRLQPGTVKFCMTDSEDFFVYTGD